MAIRSHLRKLLLITLLIGPALPALAADDREAVLERLRALSPMDMDEVMWLARCLVSESNQTDEQRLVAWVVRNRVDTAYRGTTYREVILEPLQFSAFNTPSTRRTYLLGLNQYSTNKTWVDAVEIALDVYHAPASDRPFARETRHFYSPVSMKGRTTPPWAENATPLDSESLGVDPTRFKFYEQIDEHLVPFIALEKGAVVLIRDFLDETRAALDDARPRTTSRRTRLKPTGRIPRPARPTVGGTRKVGWR